MLLLGIIKKYEQKQECNLYENWELFHTDTFSPTTEIITTILFKIEGKNYREKQNHLRNLAMEFQLADTNGLSWGELAKILNFFEINAKRYGLVKEFKENCII